MVTKEVGLEAVLAYEAESEGREKWYPLVVPSVVLAETELFDRARGNR